jgi:hypothetical protein
MRGCYSRAAIAVAFQARLRHSFLARPAHVAGFAAADHREEIVPLVAPEKRRAIGSRVSLAVESRPV